jgi:hypothetical protein
MSEKRLSKARLPHTDKTGPIKGKSHSDFAVMLQCCQPRESCDLDQIGLTA